MRNEGDDEQFVRVQVEGGLMFEVRDKRGKNRERARTGKNDTGYLDASRVCTTI